MNFGQWRSLAHAPSPESWQSLRAALQEEPRSPAFYQQLLPYLQDQFTRWPRGLRLLEQLAPYTLKPDHPLWRLSEGLNACLLWHDLRAFSALCEHWGEALHVTQVGVEGQEASGSWAPWLKQAPWLKHVEHLYIEQSYELSALGLILEHPSAPSLKSLTIRCDDGEPSYVDCGLTTLAPLQSSSLETIVLSEHPLHPRELEGLSRARLPRLRQLALVVGEDGGLETLREARWLKNLTTLELTLVREVAPSAHDLEAWRASLDRADLAHVARAQQELRGFLSAPGLANLMSLKLKTSSPELERPALLPDTLTAALTIAPSAELMRARPPRWRWR